MPRDLRQEVIERITSDGAVRTPLDTNSLFTSVDQLINSGAESIAIVFLHSYLNAAHEREALDALTTKYPDVSFTASFEVAPEIREYERGSTTVANAYVKPLAENYLESLAGKIAGLMRDPC